jgi:hypothetical protein
LGGRAAGRAVEIWFQDEARIGQQGTLTRIWAKRGSRPRGLRDRRFDWAYLFGAVCPARGVGAALVMPTVDADAMNKHLAEISQCITPGAIAVLVIDGAGWHRAGALNVPENIVLLKLPAYAPELNPVEASSGHKPSFLTRIQSVRMARWWRLARSRRQLLFLRRTLRTYQRLGFYPFCRIMPRRICGIAKGRRRSASLNAVTHVYAGAHPSNKLQPPLSCLL